MADIDTKDTKNVSQKNGTSKETSASSRLWDPLTDGVKWIERYADSLEAVFGKLPDVVGTIIATFAVFTFGATLRGEWVIILVSALKQLSGHTAGGQNVSATDIMATLTSRNLKMENFGLFFVGAHVISYAIYFLFGGFLHWYFYMRKRHLAHEWKIQPTKWLSPELERHEIMVGTFSLMIVGSFSAFLACYIFNGNPSKVYFQFAEYGWLWFILQFPVLFIYMDYTTYFMHRLYHTRFLYKHFHKLHHKYKQPTAFSVTAIHPVEIMHIQLTMCLPLFTVPVHWLPFYSVVLYNYYHGILDHSGINFKAQWWQPWQPDADFHDKHHEFFHCNFGFNMFFWDKWYFYMRKRHLAHEWKIQPTKWLSPELERHEIMVGTFSLMIVGSFSAFLACYIFNGNPSKVYFQFAEYGWLWFILQFPVLFIYMDYTTYFMHRLYHTRFLYKHFHKLHHKYKQPTAFSVTAIHPVEIMHIQLTMCLPLFTVPVHWLPFYSVVLYNYYHGILDHSGINFKAQWWQPWQPDADFHDKHHEFFHCNFGFNMFFWDKLHGTMRRPELLYTEDTFHGDARAPSRRHNTN